VAYPGFLNGEGVAWGLWAERPAAGGHWGVWRRSTQPPEAGKGV